MSWRLPALLLLLVSLTAGAQVYRWVDDDGVVHFTGEPVPGADPVLVEPVPEMDLPEPAPEPAEAGAGEDREPSTGVPDYTIAFGRLEDGQTVWNDARRLHLELAVEPPLALARGHLVEVYLDGERRGGPSASTRIYLEGVDRGPHTVEARVVDAAGHPLATTGPITIFHKQHTIQRGN